MTARTVLEARNVGKTFPVGPALRNFDITVRAGQIHGLVGENGSGKSTFIKVLAGFHESDPGSQILVGGRELTRASAVDSYELGCRFVHQDLGLIDELSVADNLSLSTGFPTRYGSIRSKLMRAHATEALHRVGVDLSPEILVGELSPASKTGVAIARALRDDGANEARLIVLDEPTATLPAAEVDRLLAMLRTVARTGVGVLYVSHRLEEILELCGEVTVLRDGVKVGTHEANGLTRGQLVTLMVGERFLELNQRPATGSDATPDAARVDEPVLQVEGISSAEVVDVSFSVERGTITGIAGLTGSGRETILSTVFGGSERYAGTVKVDGRPVSGATPRDSIAARIGYLPPDRNRLGAMSDMSASENLTLVRLKPFRRLMTMFGKREAVEVQRWFDDLEVRPNDIGRTLATFSGGNQQKVLFAKWLRTEPVVLLLDEPTQGVDVGAKALLHQQLVKYAESGGTVVISSSEGEELLALCERVFVMRNGVIAAELTGSRLTLQDLAHESLGAGQPAGTR